MRSVPTLLRLGVIALAVAGLVAATYPLPARACSCMGHPDLRASIDESEAAFVGTLVERRDAGRGEFGGESIYVFEVEEWVKGDLGDVIEVRSASDGAACGFEFFDGERIGAFLRLERGELHGGLCTQVDADALLAAAHGPRVSTTGIGRLLVGHGWSSPKLTVVDEDGATVAELSPGEDVEPFTGTTELRACPGGERAVQLVGSDIVVWDLDSLEIAATHEAVSPDGSTWVTTLSCRDREASSILAVARSEDRASLIEIVPDWREIIEVFGETFHIGESFVITQAGHQSDPILVDMSNGEEIPLHETPAGALQGVDVAPHPSRPILAMLETRFPEGGPVESTLFVVDAGGETLQAFEIPWEAYSPTWLDEETLIVQAYDFDDWNRSFGYLFDSSGGDPVVLEGWNGSYPVATGDLLYAVSGGDVLMADLTGGEVSTLVTLATESAGPLVLLDDPAPVTTTSTSEPAPTSTPTVPPLVAPGAEPSDAPDLPLQWIAGIALAGFVLGLIWLARRTAD